MFFRNSNVARPVGLRLVLATVLSSLASTAWAQSVCLPAPRLLTTMPMGGRAGTEVEIVVTGEHLDDAAELTFSDARLTAKRKLDAAGEPAPDRYVVSIAADCPVGLYEARVMTRLGLSASRVFSVGTLEEVVRRQPNTTLATALELPLNSICNATVTDRSVDYYKFTARRGQRVVVDCATRGIDSKLDATVILADASGRDLRVERRGGALDFTVPEDGLYVIKVHELTYKGGPAYFYRLGLWEQPPNTPIVRQPSTRTVNSFSWPPSDLRPQADLAEAEPNNAGHQAQKISLPCDLNGSFFPAADVDVFEFDAKQGDEWWIEVASERFGLPTDPAILVQHVAREGTTEQLTDVAEFSDIPSPVKVSSNGYAYDGPPYNAGTSDLLGKLAITRDGLHRLQITDLFGGTRNDERNVYRLVIRKAAPDFALVAWALHMELRNGDRNALSKPLALRGGATMALEVVAFRRDGFDGEIQLGMDGLPEGVTAAGLTIPAGQSRGLMLVTAHQDAPRSMANVNFFGRAQINGVAVTRPCRLASMAWPVPDAWSEIPSPRLIADVPVSVSGIDFAPLTIRPQSPEPLTAKVGEKVTIPLMHVRRSDFSGDTMQLRAIGAGFERVPALDVSLSADASQAVLDLAALKTPPGEYLLAFHGSAVAKYRHHPEAVPAAEAAQKQAEQELQARDAEVKQRMDELQAAAEETRDAAQKAVDEAVARQKAAQAALTAARERVKTATQTAQPRDIVDIVVTEPITLRVQPAETP